MYIHKRDERTRVVSVDYENLKKYIYNLHKFQCLLDEWILCIVCNT